MMAMHKLHLPLVVDVRHPPESRATLLIRSDGCVISALPTGLTTGLTVVSDSLGTKSASDKQGNPSGGY
jgi:hypothetical protein